jgi:hypothetical protein
MDAERNAAGNRRAARGRKDLAEQVAELAKELRAIQAAAATSGGDPLDLSEFRDALLDDTRRPYVRDVVSRETKDLVAKLKEEDLASFGVPFSDERLNARVSAYFSATARLSRMFLDAGYWGAPLRDRVWIRALIAVANEVEGGNGLVVWLRLRRLPALLLVYSATLGAVANDQYAGLAELLLQAKVIDPARETSALLGLYPSAVMEPDVARRLPDSARKLTPVNDWLHERLAPLSHPVLLSDAEFDRVFDRAEFLLGAAFRHWSDRDWAPLGRFYWKDSHRYENRVSNSIRSEFDAAGRLWPPFVGGLFGSDLEAAKNSLDLYADWAAKAGQSVF